jgi:predicted nucleic acid-binding protein
MEPIDITGLPEQAVVLLDSAPIIYFLESHPKFAIRYASLFQAHVVRRLRFAVTTITIAEVLTGPLQLGEAAVARRYRRVFDTWTVVGLTADIAEAAASLRASLRLKLPDAIQVASALSINADAMITHDRDLSRVRSLRVMT